MSSFDHDMHDLFAPARAAVPRRESIDAALAAVPASEGAAAGRGRSGSVSAASTAPAAGRHERRGDGPGPAGRRGLAGRLGLPGGPGVVRRARPVLVAALAVVLALGGLGYAAAPPIRAAVDDATGTFAGWFGVDGETQGREVRPGDRLPAYLRGPGADGTTRIVAEAGGYPLIVTRHSNGSIDFDLGDTGVGVGFPPESLLDHDVRVLGPGSMARADRDGHVPLFGVTARHVATVELVYRDGTTSPRTRVRGGFVLLAEPDRRPVAVVARNAAGKTTERVGVDQRAKDCPCIDWGQYDR